MNMVKFKLPALLSLFALLIACGGPDPPVVGESGNDNNMNVGESAGDRADGDACSDHDDCLSGRCLQTEDWPDGHCSTVNCVSDNDCHGDNTFCLDNPEGTNFCARPCDTDSSSDVCRNGYTCRDAPADDTGWCRPGDDSGSEPDPDPDPSNNDENDDNDDNGNDDDDDFLEYDVDCDNVSGSKATFSFEVSDDADSYMVVPFADGYISPEYITTPSGQIINFEGQNSFQATGAQMFGVINPTVVPAAPQFDYQFEPGTNQYTLGVQAAEICYYVIESKEPSPTIDLNIYLVGVPGIDPSNADNNINMQDMLNQVENIYAQAGVQLGEVRFPSVPSQAITNYRIIRSEDDVQGLLAYSEAPGPSADEHVSANIFITEQFSFSSGGGVLGISMGIPGAAALHGSGLSGVAMTGEYLGQAGGGNTLTAVILAHELGHFLGLFHTSEMNTSYSPNPLQDTPECSNWSNPTGCEDWGNLMFPSADVNNDELTNDQSFVIGVNPLTK